jgi:hypothetical protein
MPGMKGHLLAVMVYMADSARVMACNVATAVARGVPVLATFRTTSPTGWVNSNFLT